MFRKPERVLLPCHRTGGRLTVWLRSVAVRRTGVCPEVDGSGSFSTVLSSPPPLPLSLSFLNGFSVLGRRRRWQRESVRRVANTTIVSCGGRARPRRRRLAGCPPGCVHHSPGRGRCRRICGEREREREKTGEAKDFTPYNLGLFAHEKGQMYAHLVYNNFPSTHILVVDYHYWWFGSPP